MIERIGFVFAAGVAAGAVMMAFVGIPFVAPSTVQLLREIDKAQGAAAGQEARGDQIQTNREAEGAAAIAGVTDERASCAAQLDAQARAYERALDQMEARLDATPDACPDSRAIRPLRRVFDDARPELGDG